MWLQIDVEPKRKLSDGSEAHSGTIYFDGQSLQCVFPKDTVNQMINQGIIKQLRGQRHDEKGELVSFDYPNKVDGAGVQYSSKVFTLKEKK